MSEAIFAFLGIILGWLLSQVSRFYWDRRTEEKQIGSVRHLVQVEIDQNTNWLYEFWKKVKSPDDRDEFERTLDGEYADALERMRNTPLPQLSRRLLESQLSQLPIALRREQIVDIMDLYESFTRIQSIHSELSSIEFGQVKHIQEAKQAYTKFRKTIGEAFEKAIQFKDKPLTEVM
jgi:hypothetical protein